VAENAEGVSDGMGVIVRDCCGSSVSCAVDGRESKRGAHGGSPLAQSKVRRGAKASGWVVPGVVMMLVPKCPVCVVAYVALVSGVGISITTAAHLRVAILALCAAVLMFLAIKLGLRRVFAQS
jgi:hypothetical protein